jgi:hypothetical protein
MRLLAEVRDEVLDIARHLRQFDFAVESSVVVHIATGQEDDAFIFDGRAARRRGRHSV